jgi:predicted nucleic acid-binding protein
MTPRKHSEYVSVVPRAFTLARHPKDDHLFNLAIAGRADYLVTFETRLLELDKKHSDDGARLRELTPELRIVAPSSLAAELAAHPSRRDKPEERSEKKRRPRLR